MSDILTTSESQLCGHRDSVNVVALDPNSENILASGSEDSTCRLWDLRTRRAFKCIKSSAFEGAGVNSIAFHSNLPKIKKQKDPKQDLDSNHSSNLIYAAVENKIYTFDLRQDSIVLSEAENVWGANEDEINHLSIHGKGKLMSAADDTGTIRIFDLEQKKLHKTLFGKHSNICSAASFRPNAAWDLVSGGLDSTIVFWDISRGRSKAIFDMNEEENTDIHSASTTSTDASGQFFNPPLVHSIEFSERGYTLAAGLGDSSVAIIDFLKKKVVRRLNGHSAAVSQVHFSKVLGAVEMLFSVGNDSKVLLWDYIKALSDPHCESQDLIRKEIHHGKKLNWITTSSDSLNVYVADISKIISIYKIT